MVIISLDLMIENALVLMSQMSVYHPLHMSKALNSSLQCYNVLCTITQGLKKMELKNLVS